MSRVKKVKLTGKSLDVIEFEKNFVVPEPTKVLTATRGPVTVITKLYGDVSDDRLVLEQRKTEFRAEQLAPVPKRPERIIFSGREGNYIGADEVQEMKSRRVGHRENSK